MGASSCRRDLLGYCPTLYCPKTRYARIRAFKNGYPCTTLQCPAQCNCITIATQRWSFADHLSIRGTYYSDKKNNNPNPNWMVQIRRKKMNNQNRKHAKPPSQPNIRLPRPVPAIFHHHNKRSNKQHKPYQPHFDPYIQIPPFKCVCRVINNSPLPQSRILRLICYSRAKPMP